GLAAPPDSSLFFLLRYSQHRDLHSFPTRRSSDLLRPHAKTHKCVELGRLQLARGARGLTVSTLVEAEVFARAWFEDLTWAFPIRSEEHTSELQSRRDLVCRLLLEKKKENVSANNEPDVQPDHRPEGEAAADQVLLDEHVGSVVAILLRFFCIR